MQRDEARHRLTAMIDRIAAPAATALIAVLLVAGLEGCGTTTPGGSTTAPTPTHSLSCQAEPTAPGGGAVLTEAATGSTVCLTIGEHLEVYLHGSPSVGWAAITLSGAALSPSANGKGTLAVGVTGGFFVATAPGEAHLRSTRRDCATPATAAKACADSTFAVDVQVS